MVGKISVKNSGGKMEKKDFRIAFLISCLVALLACTAEGVIVEFDFPIEGSQEVPPSATPAFGTGLVTLNTETNELQWNITFEGLLGAETFAHFHGPAPVGVNAGAQIPLDLGSPKIGSQMLTAGQASDVLDGLWYVNIHTTEFEGGEIRGQVVPEPLTISLLGLGLLVVRTKR